MQLAEWTTIEAELDHVRLQTKYHAAANPTDGAELIWKMLQILEKGNEESWVHTIIDVRNICLVHHILYIR